jgi:hypothetical protein
MTENNDTAPAPQVPPPPEQPAGYQPAGYQPQMGYGQPTGYGTAGYGQPAGYGTTGYGQPMGYGTAGQYGPAPAAPSVPSRPSRRVLAIVAAVIGGVLLVGAGFGTGLVVGHRTARWDGPAGLLSRIDQRGELRGPGFGSGEQLRPFGGHGRRSGAAPAPVAPTPAPTS